MYVPKTQPLDDPSTRVSKNFVNVGLGFDFGALLNTGIDTAGKVAQIRKDFRTRPSSVVPTIIQQATPGTPTVVRVATPRPATVEATRRKVNWPLVIGLGGVAVALGFVAFRGRARRNPPRSHRRRRVTRRR